MVILQLTSLLLISIVFVMGDITVTQTNVDTLENWVVRGIATYVHGGNSQTIFYFQCKTSDDKFKLVWERAMGVDIGTTIADIPDGIELQLSSPTQDSAGVYICRSSETMEEIRFILTDHDPSAIAEIDSVTRYVGDSVTINMFVSTLTPLNGLLTWKVNNTNIINGNFSNSNTSLTVNNLELSDAGTYRIIISIGAGINAFVNSSSTVLHILDLPSISVDPVNTTVLEWQSITLTCTGNNGDTITWFKENGVLPDTALYNITSNDNAGITSVLTISDLRTVYSGQYYCNITTNNEARYAVSSSATLTVIDSARFSYAPSVGNAVILSDPLLYLNANVNTFNITCEGSQPSLYWATINNSNVSFITTNNPYQYNLLGNGFSRLVFNSFVSQNIGEYSCVSGQEYNTVYITNDNPVIYTQNNSVIVGQTTDVVLKVFVGGSNPTPLLTHVSWSFNGSIISDNVYYTLQNDNTELVINNAPSNMTTGLYQSTIATSQGTDSVYITISYFDPPVITVSPQSIISPENSTVVYECTVTSSLNVTIEWYRDDTIISNNGLLTINDITVNDNGTYSCVVRDNENIYTITENALLIVQYAPTAYVQSISIEGTTSLTINLEESVSVPTYFCSANGYPKPNLIWSFNGGQLPDGISSSADGDFLQLKWSRNLLYLDNGTFACHATNNFGESVANLFINVYAIPTISTVYSTNGTILLPSSNTLIVQSPITTSITLSCLAHGLPIPSLHWIDDNGNKLNNIFYSQPCGTVLSTLEWNQTLIPGPVHCIVSNVIDNNTVTVSWQQTDNNNMMTNSGNDNNNSDQDISEEMINMRIKLITNNCTENLLSNLGESLLSTVRLLLIASYRSCDYIDNILITVSSSSCVLVNSSVFIITIATDTVTQTQNIYNIISGWMTTSPLMLLKNQSYRVDSECDLLLQESDSLYSCVQTEPSLSATPTEPTIIPTDPTGATLTVVWIAIVGIILFLLLIVVIALVLILFLCIKSINRKDLSKEGTKAEAWSDQSNEVISLETWRTASTNVSTQEFCTTSFRSNQLQQSHSQDSGTMVDNPQYTMGSQIQHIRQSLLNNSTIDTLPAIPMDDQTDSSHEWDTRNHSNHHNSVTRIASHDSLQSATPVFSKPLSVEPGEESNYAIIRPDARIEEKRFKNIDLNNKPPPHHRRATLPSPLRASPVKKIQPILYAEPEKRPLGSTSTLHHALPYSQPVSSMGSLRNVGTMSYRPPPPDQSISLPGGNSNGGTRGGIISPLNVVDETSPIVQQQWYHSADSDIVTPTFDPDITPYAVTPSSLIEPNPYSQPTIEPNNIDQQSTISSSSPSTIRPTYLHTASVQYETVNV